LKRWLPLDVFRETWTNIWDWNFQKTIIITVEGYNIGLNLVKYIPEVIPSSLNI
jgi:hypothetical protein